VADHPVTFAQARARSGSLGIRLTREANRRTYSDLDLAVIADTPLPFAVSGGMKEDFSESDLPFRVDVLDWAVTQDYFRASSRETKLSCNRSVRHRGPV